MVGSVEHLELLRAKGYRFPRSLSPSPASRNRGGKGSVSRCHKMTPPANFSGLSRGGVLGLVQAPISLGTRRGQWWEGARFGDRSPCTLPMCSARRRELKVPFGAAGGKEHRWFLMPFAIPLHVQEGGTTRPPGGRGTPRRRSRAAVSVFAARKSWEC